MKKSIIIEQSRKCKTSLQMSSCNIETFFTFVWLFYYLIIILLFYLIF